MANALNRHEGLHPTRFTPAIIRRDAFGPRRAFRVFVGETPSGAVVGYAAFLVGYNTDVAARDMFMLDLFVQPAWRSRGVGRALVTAVAREAVRRGLPDVEWGVRGDNTRALRFYRSLGARVGRIRIATLRGRGLTSLVSERR
jgi:ribosomal protein S18 acetylase RimI-like enzyme